MSDRFYKETRPEAFMGTTSGAKTMADGTLRLQIDIDPLHINEAFTAFGAPGSSVALAKMAAPAAVEQMQKPKGKGEFGMQARALRLSGFFRNQKVWEAAGTDKQYLEWLKTRISALDGDQDFGYEDGEGRCVPAHYRRVEHGSGTGIKPEYCAIPLTNAQHQLQHAQGHDAIGSDEWWAENRINYLTTWAWERVRDHFGVDSFTEIDPKALNYWASENMVAEYLPIEYQF
jgi:hypothetical protein